MVVENEDGVVEFQFYRPQARSVSLAGDFNGWNKSAFQMGRDEQGWWRCRMQLASGAYQFRYFADGEWYLDYAAFGLERGPFGWNSVVNVSATKASAPTAAA